MIDRTHHQIITCTLVLIAATTLATACSGLPVVQSRSASGETVASSNAASSASNPSVEQANAPGASGQSPKASSDIEATGGSELTIKTSSPSQAGENATASHAEAAATDQSPRHDGQASMESGTPQGTGNPPGNESKTAPRAWVVDHQEVWVPDIVEVVVEPERTETAYEWRDVLACNVSGCGFSTESSGEMASHWGQHALNGIDEGYSSVPRQVPAGTQFIPAVTRQEDHGHYELIETGGHWE